MGKFTPIIFLFLFWITPLAETWATHNRAGEITYEQTGPFTVRCTITTFTKTSSVAADRDSLEICWGDGVCERIGRVNEPDVDPPNGSPDGEKLPNDIKFNLYVLEHTYPSLGRYRISTTDPNRISGIKNIPNSVNIPFTIWRTVTLRNPDTRGPNNSPVLKLPPIDDGCVGQPFIHNPTASEPDNDSLAYRLVVPYQTGTALVPGYVFPDQISPGGNNNISFDESTGTFLWDSPQVSGDYNIAILIIEFRNGQPLDTMIRDMQIFIAECDNMPPVVTPEIDEICVIAGEVVEFEVTATDPDLNPPDKVRLEAFGGPLDLAISPAMFFAPSGYADQPVIGTFVWQTACEHISDQFYYVTFKASDNNRDTLVDLKQVRIKVVGPKPEDVQTIPGSGQVEVTWELPYFCEDAADDYFNGFAVYRKQGSTQFPIDTCLPPDLGALGYTIVERNYQVTQGGRYHYLDTDVERGRVYCYRIVAEFSKKSRFGTPFNRVAGLPSDEACVQLSRDIPLMINVDVEETSTTDGRIFVRWTRPVAEDLDTLQNPGPYRYELQRAEGIAPGGGFITILDRVSPTFSGAIDTSFTDDNINTVTSPYTYRVAFYVNNEPEPLGTAPGASSIFLTVSGTDNANQLSWEESVPWENNTYTIYRKLPGASSFDSLATVFQNAYLDEGLKNGLEYCYYVESRGSYGISGVPSPLINRSQQVCSVPVDNIPPCPPELTVANDCDVADSKTPEEFFFNYLNWTDPNRACEGTDDAIAFRVYFSLSIDGPFELIYTSDSLFFDTTYEHKPELGIAGCYAVTALDTAFRNESAFSNIVCVENCPVYELPNVFTPNEDGQNDLFIPFPYRFIESIDLKVFNRWGGLVFETSDPDINWNGTNLRGEDLAEGTYFYTCKVFERGLTGSSELVAELEGYIELVRGM